MKRISPLIASIIFATVAISGSLVFLATQLSESGDGDIDAAIERYVARQQVDQGKTQANQQKAAENKAKSVRPADDTDHIRGNKNAIITLIEYSDFECPFCQRFHPTAKEFLDKNKENVNWVYRHFPLSFHDPIASQEAVASECASELGGDAAFWKYTDEIYTRTQSNGKGLEISLTDLAVGLGLNKSKFQSCLESNKYDKLIKNHIVEGSAAGVTGTPGNILRNNETGEVRFIPGAYPLSALEDAMNDLLK